MDPPLGGKLVVDPLQHEGADDVVAALEGLEVLGVELNRGELELHAGIGEDASGSAAGLNSSEACWGSTGGPPGKRSQTSIAPRATEV